VEDEFMNHVLLAVSVLFGIMAWAIILTRIVSMHRARMASRQAAPGIDDNLNKSRLQEAIDIAEKWKDSHVASVAKEGLMSLRNDMGKDTSAGIVTRVERAMTRETDLALSRLRGPIRYLEVIGAISPIVALIYSHQAAIYFALLVTAPSIGYGIFLRHQLSDYEIEIKNTVSQVLDYTERFLSRQPH
jgi:biopolymer transport protein ExbB/TolQ